MRLILQLACVPQSTEWIRKNTTLLEQIIHECLSLYLYTTLYYGNKNNEVTLHASYSEEKPCFKDFLQELLLKISPSLFHVVHFLHSCYVAHLDPGIEGLC